MTIAGVNGFGRFGQHLLKYWLEHLADANFRIGYINDVGLDLETAYDLLVNDPYLGDFFSNKLKLEDGGFVAGPNDQYHITYTNESDAFISWMGKPAMFFECSGRNTNAKKVESFLTDETKLAIISATSLNADQILVFGHNHQAFMPDHRVVSYGSCTVNAYVPLADFIHKSFGVLDSSVTIIHNLPEYLLPDNQTPLRKACTLEVVAPELLDFISAKNFTVDYTVIPYTGVSIIDYRFRLKDPARDIVDQLRQAIHGGALKGLYRLNKTDPGPNKFKFSAFSAELIEPGIRLVGDNLYIHAYFDNENSVNRYYDLVQHMVAIMATNNKGVPDEQ